MHLLEFLETSIQTDASEIPEPSSEVKNLPYYCPPDSIKNLALRIPLWTWRLRMRAQWTKLTKNLALPTNASAQDIKTYVEQKNTLLYNALLKLCAPPPLPTRGVNELFKIEGSTEPTYRALFLRVTQGDFNMMQLEALLPQALQAPHDQVLLQNVREAYNAWEPMEAIIQIFFALFRSEEGKWMPWTSQGRWKDMKRKEVLEEWNLILEDTDFVRVYDAQCLAAVVLMLRGSMALQPLYAAALRQRRKTLKKLASSGEGAGAGAGATGPPFSIKSSLFYCLLAQVEDMEDLYEYKMSHLPLSNGWVETDALLLTNDIAKGAAQQPEFRFTTVAASALEYGL